MLIFAGSIFVGSLAGDEQEAKEGEEEAFAFFRMEEKYGKRRGEGERKREKLSLEERSRKRTSG